LRHLDWGYLRSKGASDYFNYVRYFDEVFADPGDTGILQGTSSYWRFHDA